MNLREKSVEEEGKEATRSEKSRMKSVTLTPTSPAKTPTTAGSRSEVRSSDSCYYPGCRKDTNCHCNMCLASIRATRDLVGSGSLVSLNSLTKISAKKALPPMRPLVLSDPMTPPATPETGSTVMVPVTPPPPKQTQLSQAMESTAKSRLAEKKIVEKERSWVAGHRALSFLVGALLLWVVDSGFSAGVLKGFGPRLTPEAVRQVGEESRSLASDFKGRLEVLQKKIDEMVEGGVSNCGSQDSVWELNQEGHLFFHWRCVIYKSVAEEVSIWGSPLRTSGLLPTMFLPRWLTLLSGRITEWPDGKLMSTLRASNSSSWTYEKWSSAAVQLDPNTWVLEYERSALFQGPRMIPATWELLKLRFSKMAMKLKQMIWKLLLVHSFTGSRYYSTEDKLTQPT
ncbi:uncharacterized protein [Typha angustifolia]|uniref:uncharacterized protein isoform X2 n=1 Tax=Typha angustifolia TaxID=59011 RepID=UPI003C2D6A22